MDTGSRGGWPRQTGLTSSHIVGVGVLRRRFGPRNPRFWAAGRIPWSFRGT